MVYKWVFKEFTSGLKVGLQMSFQVVSKWVYKRVYKWFNSEFTCGFKIEFTSGFFEGGLQVCSKFDLQVGFHVVYK